MDHQFKRVLDLVRRTGDRLIVTDPDGHNAYVVMDLDQYESLIDLESDYFEDELSAYSTDNSGLFPDEEAISLDSEPDFHTEKIDMMPPKDHSHESPSNIWQAMKPAQSAAETWDISRMDSQTHQELENQYKTYQEQVTNPPISPDPSKKAVNDEEFGEDQFYLEPID
ncbi:type II toxin-antitoxin system Phd/YefM family antitoxin [Patescibacteria group bacterium]|nr:type II toxin-antitoxin system Phd/YefM family antitoxin [Patescibacteria group bacterium]MBU1705851.1 type II toxin-antitoxin system Phd/YefM family antitoxin [Patescibacteria group bacterium]